MQIRLGIKPSVKPKFSIHHNVWLFLGGVVSALLYGYLSQEIVGSSIKIERYIGYFGVAFVVYACTIFLATRGKSIPPLTYIVAFAVLFRVIGITVSPQFEDDYFRYIWDGFILSGFDNPYQHPPSHYFANENIPDEYQDALSGVNYPDLPTIYAPTLQFSFLIAHWIGSAQVMALQFVYSVADVLLILLLAQMTDRRSLMLYAWNPLVIKEIAFTAHPDVAGVMLLIAAIFFVKNRPLLSVASLALSVCAKPFAWVIAPFILMRLRKTYVFLFIVLVLMIYLPFLVSGATDFTTLSTFGKHWEYNAAIYSVLSQALPAVNARLLCGAIFVVMYLVYVRNYRASGHTNIRGDILLGGLLILSPVINPWYLLWILPFASLNRDIWPWVASCAVLLSYFTGLNMDDPSLASYEQAKWVKPVEFGMIALAILFDVYRRRRERGSERV